MNDFLVFIEPPNKTQLRVFNIYHISRRVSVPPVPFPVENNHGRTRVVRSGRGWDGAYLFSAERQSSADSHQAAADHQHGIAVSESHHQPAGDGGHRLQQQHPPRTQVVHRQAAQRRAAGRSERVHAGCKTSGRRMLHDWAT